MKFVAALACGLALFAAPQKNEDPERWLQTAIQAETVDGDLKTAIEQYKKIIGKAGASRAVVAKALVRLGMCYEREGNAEARKQYERVLRDYADQRASVAEARAKLGATAVAARGDHAVWTGPKVDLFGRVSPDGRHISYVDWIDTGNLEVHDIATNTDRALTPNQSWADGSFAEFSSISRDGKQVAYGWFNAKNECELRVAPLGGAGVPESRRVFANPEEVKDIAPYDWSPDGRWIAAHLQMKDFSGRIALIAVADGALRVLKSDNWQGPSKIFFSPDGRYLAYDGAMSDTNENRDVFVMAADGSRETAAATHPARDIVMGWAPDGKRLLFASDRTGSMCLWAVRVADGKPQGAPEMVKPDIGTPWSLGLTDAGALYVFKRIGGFDVQAGAFDAETGRVTPRPGLGITHLSAHPALWSRDGKSVAYQVCSETGGGPCKLMIRSLETGETRAVHPHLAYLAWPDRSPDGREFVTGGRDLKGHDGVFRIDAATGATTRVADVTGVGSFPQWSPDGKKIYYLDRAAGAYVERDLATGTTREVLRRPGAKNPFTVSRDGRYLALIENDRARRKNNLVLAPVVGGEVRTIFSVDAPVQLLTVTGWTPDGKAVVAGTYQGADISLWRAPLDGGSARRLETNTAGWSTKTQAGFRLSADGRQITYVTGKSAAEIWALENFLPAPSAGK